MTRKRADFKPCHRCGVQVFHNPRARLTGICSDCREVDPQYVAALRTGQPVVARVSA